MALTDHDFNKLEAVVRVLLQEAISPLKNEINEKLGSMPSREEFYNSQDKLMGELKNIREEQIVANARLSNHEDRIIVLEEIQGLTHRGGNTTI